MESKGQRMGKQNLILAAQKRRLDLRRNGESVGDQLANPTNDVLDPFIAGMEQLRRAEIDAAAEAFRAATQRDPQNATNWLMLAESLVHRQQYDRAVAAFDMAASMLPDSVIPVYQRGIAHLKSNRHPAAIADFTTVLRQRPELCRARLNRGLAHLGLGEFKKSLQDINSALEQGCDDTRALLIRARLHRRLGDVAAAEQDTRHAMQQQPLDVEGWLARGVARQVRDPQGAVDDFHRALEQDPFSSRAWQNIAHCQSELLGDLEGSLVALNKSLELDPESDMGLAGRGVVHARLGDVDAALKDADRLLGRPLSPILTYQVGCIHALCSHHDPERTTVAVTHLARAIRQDPKLGKLARWDQDLQAIAEDPAFQSMIKAAETIQNLAEAKILEKQQRDEQPKNEQ